MEKVAEFIVLDDQPLSVVENVCFQHLIKHLSLTIRCQTGISSLKRLSQISKINTSKCVNSFQNAWKTLLLVSQLIWIWSSLLSLTAQWIDSSFILQKAVLQAGEALVLFLFDIILV